MRYQNLMKIQKSWRNRVELRSSRHRAWHVSSLADRLQQSSLKVPKQYMQVWSLSVIDYKPLTEDQTLTDNTESTGGQGLYRSHEVTWQFLTPNEQSPKQRTLKADTVQHGNTSAYTRLDIIPVELFNCLCSLPTYLWLMQRLCR
jgi:hypothetical protein